MSSTSPPPQGTGSGEDGSLLATYKKFKDLFDALPGYIKALAALLTALAAVITAFAGFAGGRAASGSPAQPTVYTTVTDTATVIVPATASSSVSPPARRPAASPVAATSPAAGTDLSALQPVSTVVDHYTANGAQQIGISHLPRTVSASVAPVAVRLGLRL